MPTTNTPYRLSGESPARPAPPPLVVTWDATEDTGSGIKILSVSYGVPIVFVGAAMLWSVSPPLALGGALACLAGGLALLRARPPRGVGLEVIGDALVISRPGEPKPTAIPIAAIDNVEVEHKAIQRVTYQQRINDAVPSTELSGDVELARIVIRLAGGAAPERLAETWAPVFVCMDRFGKVRTFLRAHGWVPLPERDAR